MDRFLERYAVVRELSVGMFGVVQLCVDRRSNLVVVLKRVPNHYQFAALDAPLAPHLLPVSSATGRALAPPTNDCMLAARSSSASSHLHSAHAPSVAGTSQASSSPSPSLSLSPMAVRSVVHTCTPITNAAPPRTSPAHAPLASKSCSPLLNSTHLDCIAEHLPHRKRTARQFGEGRTRSVAWEQLSNTAVTDASATRHGTRSRSQSSSSSLSSPSPTHTPTEGTVAHRSRKTCSVDMPVDVSRRRTKQQRHAETSKQQKKKHVMNVELENDDEYCAHWRAERADHMGGEQSIQPASRCA
jgi:hypothetical protein